MAKAPYTQRTPFTNKTSLTVGQTKIVKGQAYTVTAITRVTDKQYKIYGVPTDRPIKIEEYKTYQAQRESGRLNVYLPGIHILDVMV